MKRKLLRTLSIVALAAAASLPLQAQSFNGKPTYLIQTTRSGMPIGDIEIELFPAVAPLHVANFDNLVSTQFYDSTAFHRVIPGFMIQGGDPNSRSGPRSTWGYGQPGQPTVNAEFSAVSHVRGIFSAARSANINSATSQFFIVVAPALHLDGQYSAYGRVTSGMSVVDNIVASPRDAANNPIEKVEMFITRTGSNTTPAIAPNLDLPADGFQGAQQNQTVSWSAVPDAALYTLDVATDPAFNNLVLTEDLKQTATSYALNGLQPQTQYYWRMNTNNGGYISPWSAVRSFTTGLAAPELLLPINGYNSATTATVLEWAASPGADAYRVQMAATPLFTQAGMLLDTTGVLGLSLQLQNLQLNTRYYWRVQPLQNGTPGFVSAIWNFRVTVTGRDNWVSQAGTLEVQPNPASNAASVAYSVYAEGPVQLRLLDLNGRQVTLIETRHRAPGEYRTRFDTSLLAPGIYVLQLQNHTGSTSRKLVVMH